MKKSCRANINAYKPELLFLNSLKGDIFKEMNKILLLLLCFLGIFTTQAQPIKKVSIEELNQYIQAADKPLVINFWATFCKPCIEEIPFFLEGQKSHPDVELVLVSLDLPVFYPKRIEQFLQSKQISGATQFWLNESNADSFCPKIDGRWDGAIPVTLWVNPRKGYRKFVNRAMTAPQIELAYRELIQ